MMNTVENFVQVYVDTVCVRAYRVEDSALNNKHVVEVVGGGGGGGFQVIPFK